MLPRNCHIPEELLRSRGTTVPGPSRAPESCGKPRHSELAENPQGLGGGKADLAGKELEKPRLSWLLGHTACPCPVMTS